MLYLYFYFCPLQGHLHELGITILGDRIYLMELIGLLKKKKKEVELSAAKWSGMTPAPGIAYKEDCGECCLAYFLPCCLAKTYWRVTGQGVFYKREPPCGLWTEGEKLLIFFIVTIVRKTLGLFQIKRSSFCLKLLIKCFLVFCNLEF